MTTGLSLRALAPRQGLVLLTMFAAVTTLLAIAYFAFLRVDYTPVWSGLKAADAAAIVAELEAKGVEHRLSDGGTTIQVPAPQADSVRLAIAGSDVPMKGAVGFELFNKSDMGLTDFAQKINYQRALQGELARSIMLMDGVEAARVHLAMPERALFRGDKVPPKAAVEVIARPGRTMSRDRVAGIQRLVAAAVPELPLAEVVVLDGTGRVISEAVANALTGEMDEQSAIQAYFSARARAALENQLPGVRLTIRVNALRTPAPPESEPAAARRDFALHLQISSPQRLAAEDEDVVRRTVMAALEMDSGRGDTIAFDVAVPAPTITPPVYAVGGGSRRGAGDGGVPQRGVVGCWVRAVRRGVRGRQQLCAGRVGRELYGARGGHAAVDRGAAVGRHGAVVQAGGGERAGCGQRAGRGSHPDGAAGGGAHRAQRADVRAVRSERRLWRDVADDAAAARGEEEQVRGVRPGAAGGGGGRGDGGDGRGADRVGRGAGGRRVRQRGGGDRQVSPDAGFREEARMNLLADRHLGGQIADYRSALREEKSLYDLGTVVFAGGAILLKEHFRCVAPVIEYSKAQFYAHQLVPLRLPSASERLDPPLIDVFVEDGYRRGKINPPEVDCIVDAIGRIADDPALAHRSIGVTTLLGQEQAVSILTAIEQILGSEIMLRHDIRVGEPAAFQGDERDIMFLSLVAERGSSPLSGLAFEQRFNVAASRARDRMVLVRSVELEDLRPTDKLRRSLIEHFHAPFAAESHVVEDRRTRCESPFEREMYDLLVERGYRVDTQVPVGTKRIDIVVEGSDDCRLAIECDGDRYHGPEQWPDDMARQRMLERAGWTVWRCFASRFVRERDRVIEELADVLAARGIHPERDGDRPPSRHTEHRRWRSTPAQTEPVPYAWLVPADPF